MKKILKITAIIVIILVLIFTVLSLARVLLNFDFFDTLKSRFGKGTELESVRVNVGQEYFIPVFEIVSLEIFYPKNLAIIEADKREWWRLSIGTVYILVEYDSYLKLGVRKPESISIERVDNTIYVDEATINIELLDVKLNNFKHVRTFTSNPFVLNTASEEFIFQAMNEMEKELTERLVENGHANFESAKKNFMENYKNLCNAMDLEVVWR
jgi:hypothetical protein